MRFLRLLCASVTVAAFASTATAAPITNIFNTGVNGAGVAFGAPNVVDPHYTIISPPNFTAVTVDDTTYPFPPWLPNNSFSRWIGPAANSFGPSVPFIYRTTFTVPASAILSTVNVTGDWATDDPGTDIRINGVSTLQTSASYSALTPFSVTSGFVVGTNTLDFYLVNVGGGPTGLRVDHVAGSFQVPEPTALALLVCGGLIIGANSTRRERRGQR